MKRAIDPAMARRALAQRLRAAARVLIDEPLPVPDLDPARDAAVVLDLLVRRVHAEPSPDWVWLLCVAVSSCLPSSDEVQAVRRQFELRTVQQASLWLLDTSMQAASRGSPTRELHLAVDQVVVDVDHSAQHDLHTGIQQVVRNTLPLWARDHDIVLVAWTPGCTAQRTLSRSEHDRVLHWRSTSQLDSRQGDDVDSLPLVVPWRSTLVLAEVPPAAACARLAALGQYSGNTLSAIGYDCVPIVSADMVPIVEPNRFARYLSVVKHAHHVAGISISARTEFGGFTETLPNQGLAGPAVVECLLPAEGIGVAPAVDSPKSESMPTVLSVGSFEPRKNHLALLHAAEILWREGLAFRLRLIGGSGWGHEVPNTVRALKANGYPLTIESRVATSELAAAYRAARFTVFPSLHEGYGLPVAESIAFGTPVITSNYGSTREIGEGRGAELIDPRKDEELVNAMRRLLRDDARLAALRAETGHRSSRSWEDYATEAWHSLVSSSRVAAAAGRTR